MTSSIDNTIDANGSRLRQILWRSLKNLSDQELNECATDENVILRTSAAREIQMRGTKEGFEFAFSLVDSHRFENREIAAFILGQFGSPAYKYWLQSVDSLLKLLEDPYYEVRATAVYAFSFFPSEMQSSANEIVKKIVLLASDPEWSVRLAVSHTLGFMYFEEAKICLNNLINDPIAEVRNDAEYGLELHEERLNSVIIG